MIQRLALNNTVIQSAYDALEDYIGSFSGGMLESGELEAIVELYNIVPDEKKYEGRIYRGVSIGNNNVSNLLNNNEFRTWENYDAIESWSADREVATQFSMNKLGTEGFSVGLVLQSHTNRQDIAFDMSQEVLDYVNEYAKENHVENAHLSDYMSEKEVMVVPEGSQRFTLCESVNYLTVDNQSLAWKQPEDFQKLMNRLQDMDRLKLEEMKSYGQYPDVTLYECDGEGNIRIDTLEYY